MSWKAKMVKIMKLQILEHRISRGRYRCLGHLVQSYTERISNLHDILSFRIWNWTLFYFEKWPASVQYICLWLTMMHVYYYIFSVCCISLPHLKRPLNYCLTWNWSMAQKRLGTAGLKQFARLTATFPKASSSGICTCPSRGLFCGCTFPKVSNWSLPNIYFLLSSSGRAEAKHKLSRQLCRGGTNWWRH